jgi:hypothetical protein
MAAVVLVVAALEAQITVPTTLPPAARAGGNITTKPPVGPLPRHANGRPDLTGLWLRRGGTGNISQGLPKGETMPLLPQTLKRMQALQAKEDPQTNCLPLATPRGNPYPFRLVETPAHLFIINESMHGFRQVFMDGRIEIFPDDVWEQYSSVTCGKVDWERILDQYGVDALVLDAGYHAKTGLLPRIEGSANWQRIYQSHDALLYVRKTAVAQGR